MQSLTVLAPLVSELAGGQMTPPVPNVTKNTLVLQGLKGLTNWFQLVQTKLPVFR